MKIICYNILDGGLGRLDPIYETLLFLDGDIVGLCEADDSAGARYLAEKLGMDFVIAEGRGKHGVALLSRLPIQRMTNLSVADESLDRGAMDAVVQTSSGPLRIVVAHLRPGQTAEDEQARLGQAAVLLASLGDESESTILMGDFNAAAPYHPFDPDAASPSVRQALTDRNATSLDFDVVEDLCKNGWVDAYHKVCQDSPKHTYTTGFPCSRFDYIWLSEDLAGRLVASDIEQGGFAPYCSDHYPIWAELTADN